MDRRNARRGSIDARVSMCADLVNSEAGEPWIVWCDLNAESEALTKAIRGAVEVRGSDDADTKEERLRAFADGRIRVLVTKPSIAGFGLNWQHCARVAFVGVTDSWEAYYQAVRRCWRFGQKREVRVHIFASEAEGSVVANLARKERDAAAMADSLSAETRDAVMAEVRGAVRTVNTYEARKAIRLPSWLKSESEVA
jgi:superfamily II DNA or RNA helicase